MFVVRLNAMGLNEVVFLRLISFKLIKLRSVFNALKRILNAYQTDVKRVINAFDLRFNEFKMSFFLFGKAR